MKYRFYCQDHKEYFTSDEEPTIEIRNSYGTFRGIVCPLCQGEAKVIGTVTRFNVQTETVDSTRKQDLEVLSDYSGKGIGKSKEILDKVYERSKDPVLAKMRSELSQAHGANDVPKTEKVENKIRSYEKANYGR